MALTQEVLLAFRPKTLTAALVPCVAATALAWATGQNVDGQALVFALMAAFLIQIGTNLVNDAVDFKKGADTPERIGPRRITAAGVLSARRVMALGTLCFVLAVAFGIPLVLKGGWPIIAIGLVSVLMGYAYTAGPFPLAYLGLGDLFVILFFGLLAVGGLYFIHTGQVDERALWLGLQIGFHATVLIAINNLRDRAGDAKVGKKTMAVRFGESFSKAEIIILTIAPFVMNLFWWEQGWRWAALLPLLALPLALKLLRGILREAPGQVYNRFLGMAAGVHLLFGLLLSLGLWLS
ncbi:MAG: 1,4-dihydroxy-2-naphthoate octaprenyltransferase [Bdellovibrionaceae bacterium]|nr:1,4-dihydroxy-2-naphthoate octaprenyltransferase [Pseudobdellovibrionaceae bacterium]MBX3032794.1 1,4-dihydroxy-2-naphthoate octaprenyltransferase [Pseudobdellovibrionaceae bacterium]